MSRAVHLDGITKRFPGVVANDNVDLTIEPGSIHALLGENGAGKTTLMNVLYGLYEPTEGRVVVDGQPCEFDSPRDAIENGIGMIHQHFMLVDTLSIAENIVLGNEPRKWGGLAMDSDRAVREVRELSDQYGFDVDPNALVEDVSVGVQQRVEILKALYRGADVLILDEPTAVLTPQEIEDLLYGSRRTHGAGKEHHLHHAQTRRGHGGRRPNHRPPGRQERRVGRYRRDDSRGTRGTHGRPRSVARNRNGTGRPGRRDAQRLRASSHRRTRRRTGVRRRCRRPRGRGVRHRGRRRKRPIRTHRIHHRPHLARRGVDFVQRDRRDEALPS